MKDNLKLKIMRVGSFAPGDVHERCTDCEVHHEAATNGKPEGFVILKGQKDAIDFVSEMMTDELFDNVKIVPFDLCTHEDMMQSFKRIHESNLKLVKERNELLKAWNERFSKQEKQIEYLEKENSYLKSLIEKKGTK